MRTRNRLVLVVYAAWVAAAAWCYFGIPAPERWQFVKQSLYHWWIFVRG